MTGEPGIEALRAVLARAAGSGIATLQDLTVAGREQGCRMVLGRIAATMLPRRIAMTFDTGRRLSCLVSARRVLGMAEGQDDPSDAASLLAPGDQDRAARMVAAALEGATRVSIQVADAAEAAQADRPGIGVAQLAAALDLPVPLAPEQALAELVTEAGRAFDCAVMLGLRDTETLLGDADALHRLIGVLDGLVNPGAGGDAALEDLTGPRGMVAFGLPGLGGGHLVLMGRDGVLVAGLSERHRLPAILAAYRVMEDRDLA